ncbi:21680_t:CDS:2, partial [Gigaspora rosea]
RTENFDGSFEKVVLEIGLEDIETKKGHYYDRNCSPFRVQNERPLEIDGNSKSNALLSPPLAFSSPLARHVTMPQLPSTPKIILEQRRASANEAIFESPIMYIPPSRPSMDESLLIWNSLTKKQVDQMLHEEMNREIDFSIRLKKQQEDVDQDSRKKKTKK